MENRGLAELIAKDVNEAARKVGLVDSSIGVEIAQRVMDGYRKNCSESTGIDNLVVDELKKMGNERIVNEYKYISKSTDELAAMAKHLGDEMTSLTFRDADDMNDKRENANINTDTPMGIMLKYGCNAAKEYNLEKLIAHDIAKAHREGDIHIHDMDFGALTMTCDQINLEKLFTGGFNTGHGHIREPERIESYSSLACIAIQSNQNDQHRRAA